MRTSTWAVRRRGCRRAATTARAVDSESLEKRDQFGELLRAEVTGGAVRVGHATRLVVPDLARRQRRMSGGRQRFPQAAGASAVVKWCLLYTSDAADERSV